MRRTLLVLGFSGLTALAGCGDDPVDVAGDYTVSVTNGENDCMFDGWMAGESATNINVSITQNGSSATAEVTGGTGLWLEAVLGDNVFTGSVDGSHVELLLEGSTMGRVGTCDFTINATIDATLDGDFLEGVIRYEPQTDQSVDCETLSTCANVQEFNGNRPPS